MNGDNVYYKRNDSAGWHGPGVVIGIDNKQVLVRHGGMVVRVHTARLVGATSEDSLEETEGTQRGALEKHGDVAHETKDRPEDITEEQSSDIVEQQNSVIQEQRYKTPVDPVKGC